MSRFLYHLQLFLSRIAAFFSHEKQLYVSRFARLDELTHLLTHTLQTETSLLLGLGPLRYILRLAATPQRQELGNCLIVAPPRSGKSALAISQLLAWEHSVIVSDIKGELYANTAGFRKTLGPVFVIDPVAGVGHCFDPFAGRTTERALYTLADQLLFEPTERDPIFLQRAKKMLTQMTRAGRLENATAGFERFHLLPYVGRLLTAGPKYTAEHLHALDPELATKFLSGALEDANFADDRFLLSCWGTLDAKLWPLLTDDVLACFNGADFSAADIMRGPKPVSVYMRLPESELNALSPLLRLLFGSLLDSLKTTYDTHRGAGCRPVLVIADEAGRTAIPMLADAASTVVGRRIYLWIAVQSLSQLASHEASHTTQDEKRTAEGYTRAGLRRGRGRDALVLRAR
jgi:type IV secretion system protein VirD4